MIKDRPGLPELTYAEAGKIVNAKVCAKCHRCLTRDFHPSAKGLRDWTVYCQNGCKPGQYVSKKYIDTIKAQQWADTKEIQSLHKESTEMPLPGTHNATPTFREIGKLRKGIMVTQNRNGKEVTYPREVDYWVMDFDEQEVEAKRVFQKEYTTDKPDALNIIVPFDDVERFWDANLFCFKGGNMIARAGLNADKAIGRGLDPENTIFFERLFNVKTNTWAVKHWEVVDGASFLQWHGGEGDALSFGQSVVVDMMQNRDPQSSEGIGPLIYSTGSGNKSRDYYLTPSGTLRILIKELVPFMGYMTLHTTSKRDIGAISGELAGLALRAKQAGIPLHQVPMQLVRRKEAGRDKSGKTVYHHNTHIILDPAFSEKMYHLQVAESELRFAQLDVIEVPALEAGEDVVTTSVKDVEDGYFEELPDNGDPKEWTEAGEARRQEDYQWLCDKAGIDIDTATAIWKGLEKDYSASYDNVLLAYANPLGLE